MKRLLAALIALGAILIYPAVTNADSHQLIVDGVTYQSTKEAGSSIHWETFDSSPLSATFAERGQTWAPGDNGSDHLPCDYGIHWISNDNVLTISHCLEAPPSTTGPTTTSSTSTTSSTTLASTTSSTSSTLAPTTTAASSSTTSSTATSTEPSTTTQPPGDESSTTLSPSTSSSVPQTPPIQPPTTPPPAPSTKLPSTGGDTGLMAVWAVAVLIVGWALIAAARRRA